MATILSKKKSTYGGPYAFYTVTVTTSDRTASSIKCKVTVTGQLQYAESWQGTGITITPYIKLNGTTYTMPVLKSSSETWSGTGSRSVSKTVTISGLSKTQTSISASFRVDTTDDTSSLTNTTCSDVTFSKAPSYTVTYKANGGSGAPSAQTKWKGETLTLSSTKPTRTGYTFKGWGTTSTDTSVNYAAGASYTANASITLYAIWKANTYTVKYNANGGSGAPSSQTKTYGKTLTLSSVEPEREGYDFLGWATSSTATTPKYYPGGSYTTNAAATLYAVWELSNGKSSFTLNKTSIAVNEDLIVTINSLSSTNIHEIKMTSAADSSNSYYLMGPLAGVLKKEKTLSAAQFGHWIPSTETDVEVKVEVITYDSNSTVLGTTTKSFNLIITEAIGKPNSPTAEVTQTLSGAIITLTEPNLFKYGATFNDWQFSSNIGILDISGNIITATMDDDINKTAVATIRAVDSRGFLSDPINIVWFTRKKGACVYKDDVWMPTTLQIYKNNAWVDNIQAYIYLDEEYLVSSDDNSLLGSDSYKLKGKDKWQTIY